MDARGSTTTRGRCTSTRWRSTAPPGASPGAPPWGWSAGSRRRSTSASAGWTSGDPLARQREGGLGHRPGRRHGERPGRLSPIDLSGTVSTAVTGLRALHRSWERIEPGEPPTSTCRAPGWTAGSGSRRCGSGSRGPDRCGARQRGRQRRRGAGARRRLHGPVRGRRRPRRARARRADPVGRDARPPRGRSARSPSGQLRAAARVRVEGFRFLDVAPRRVPPPTSPSRLRHAARGHRGGRSTRRATAARRRSTSTGRPSRSSLPAGRRGDGSATSSTRSSTGSPRPLRARRDRR